jgi:hypothetical protein
MVKDQAMSDLLTSEQRAAIERLRRMEYTDDTAEEIYPGDDWESRLEQDHKTALDIVLRLPQFERLERYEQALRKIANPITVIHEEAQADGKRVNGDWAVRVANDPCWLSGIASAALQIPLTERTEQ